MNDKLLNTTALSQAAAGSYLFDHEQEAAKLQASAAKLLRVLAQYNPPEVDDGEVYQHFAEDGDALEIREWAGIKRAALDELISRLPSEADRHSMRLLIADAEERAVARFQAEEEAESEAA